MREGPVPFNWKEGETGGDGKSKVKSGTPIRSVQGRRNRTLSFRGFCLLCVSPVG